MGFPSVMHCLASTIRAHDDHTVVSVGPYMFHNSLQRGNKASASSGDNASPPHNTFICGLPCHPAAMSRRQVAGVPCIRVIPLEAISFLSRLPSPAVSRSAISILPPTVSGSTSSKTAMSNESVVTAHTTSFFETPGLIAMPAKKFTTEPCVMHTPLGLPVEPEV